MGSFIDSTLNDGEVVRHEAKVSIWSLAGWIILGLVTLPIFIGPVFWLIAFLRWKTTELAVTNRKVVAKFGFISRDTTELLLPKVESVRVHQGIFGRIFNYGSVIISGTGTSQAPIKGISDPMIFRRQFMETQQQVVG
ncbi:PH domain-containing protein [Qipengyuania sp. YIM B01966]|uniref:PH domain-containing protein n=1 Tax=Qipengyuania sp. YIM B01966 TaxID=2778646 RepID=UPI0018F35A6C|nr:PH domain-containing protein [Qipengyuania sp. YIM B01966]